MSQENVELTHRATDAFNRRDLDAFLALADDDVVLIPRAAVLEGGYQDGHDGVRRWWQDWLGVFPDSNIEVLDVRDVGDVTVAATRLVGHGVGSDTPIIEDTIWQAVRWRGGKIVWWGTFATRAEALEAVGLSEQDAHADSPARD